MKRYIGYAVVFAAILLMAGCSGKNRKEDGYKAIVDDYAAIILQRDMDSADYDNALAAVGNYLEKQDTVSLKAARTLLQDTVLRMEEASEKITPYQMEEDFSKLLQEYGIDPEEYLMNADERKENLSDYVITLKDFDEYLSYEEDNSPVSGALAMKYEMEVKIQNVLCSYDYCGINYWFAGWEEEQLEYVRQKVHDNLQSFSAEQEAWQDDRDAVEDRMQAYLNKLEELSGEWADYLGEYQDELYQLENSLK